MRKWRECKAKNPREQQQVVGEEEKVVSVCKKSLWKFEMLCNICLLSNIKSMQNWSGCTLIMNSNFKTVVLYCSTTVRGLETMNILFLGRWIHEWFWYEISNTFQLLQTTHIFSLKVIWVHIVITFSTSLYKMDFIITYS